MPPPSEVSTGDTLTKPFEEQHPTLLPRAAETTPLESSAKDARPADSTDSTQRNETSPDVEGAIQARLLEKRNELNREVEAFKSRKDAEYREFEDKLRAEVHLRSHIRDTKFDDQTAGIKGPNNIVDGERPKAIIPEPAARTSGHIAPKDDSSDSSPPYEKELIGLFAPNFLPLLDSRYRLSPPKPPTQPPTVMASTVTATQIETSESQSLPKLKSDGAPPLYPIASSLKSSASSSFSTSSSAKKPKSPKRVTFQFEDESSVPSRSSPPPSKVVWSLSVLDNDPNFEEPEDDDEEDEGGYVTTNDPLAGGGIPVRVGGPVIVDDLSDAADDGPEVEQIENIAINGIPSAQAINIGSLRYHGDELVTPSMSLFQKQSDSVSPVSSTALPNDNSGTFKSPFSQLSSASQHGMNGFKDAKFQSLDDDDFEDGLFDLDETLPDEPERSPPHRDYSPLMIAATNQLPSISDFTLSSSVQPTAVFLPESLPAESLVFHKTMMQPPKLPAHRAIGQAGSSLTHTPFRSFGHPVPNPGAVAASLPQISNFPGFSGDSSHFRRRSINKYIPSPPPEEDNDGILELHGKPDSGQAPPTFVSPFASSLPVSINPHFASLRSPPASTSPAVQPTDQSPLSGRPSLNPSTPPEAPTRFPNLSEDDDTLNLLTESPPKPTNELDSYRRTDRFSSAPGAHGMLSPYRTKFAQEVAELAFKEDGDMPTETPVGGVDGGTGLDPGSFSLRRGSLANAMASGRQIGAKKGKVGSVGGVGSMGGGGGFSFSQRLAMEDEMAGSGRR